MSGKTIYDLSLRSKILYRTLSKLMIYLIYVIVSIFVIIEKMCNFPD